MWIRLWLRFQWDLFSDTRARWYPQRFQPGTEWWTRTGLHRPRVLTFRWDRDCSRIHCLTYNWEDILLSCFCLQNQTLHIFRQLFLRAEECQGKDKAVEGSHEPVIELKSTSFQCKEQIQGEPINQDIGKQVLCTGPFVCGCALNPIHKFVEETARECSEGRKQNEGSDKSNQGIPMFIQIDVQLGFDGFDKLSVLFYNSIGRWHLFTAIAHEQRGPCDQDSRHKIQAPYRPAKHWRKSLHTWIRSCRSHSFCGHMFG